MRMTTGMVTCQMLGKAYAHRHDVHLDGAGECASPTSWWASRANRSVSAAASPVLRLKRPQAFVKRGAAESYRGPSD